MPANIFNIKWLFRILILLIIAQLVGCASTGGYRNNYTAGQDSAPNFNIDVSKIPDAVPRAEPRSKYGNPASYIVDGKRYYVMNSAKGYDERGIASWYGMKFYNFKTSNRETYNVAGMTAASKTLPLPTYVQVTNLQNGKQVVVRVNDRGPFVSNRIIDLSYAAAVKLGVYAHGTAPVEVKAIDPYDPDLVLNQHPQATVPGNPQMYVQVGAFGQYTNAENAADKARGLTSSPVNIKTVQRDGASIYKVQIGPLQNVENTDALYAQVEQAGLGRPVTVIQ